MNWSDVANADHYRVGSDHGGHCALNAWLFDYSIKVTTAGRITDLVYLS